MIQTLKVSVLTMALTALVSLTGVANAEARDESKVGRRGKMKEMAAELNLTADQKAKMKEINKDRREVLQPKRKAMREAKEALEASLKGADSTDTVKQKFAALQKAQSNFATARFDKVLAVREVLTPEQRAKFKGLNAGGHHRHDEDESDD